MSLCWFISWLSFFYEAKEWLIWVAFWHKDCLWVKNNRLLSNQLSSVARKRFTYLFHNLKILLSNQLHHCTGLPSCVTEWLRLKLNNHLKLLLFLYWNKYRYYTWILQWPIRRRYIRLICANGKRYIHIIFDMFKA